MSVKSFCLETGAPKSGHALMAGKCHLCLDCDKPRIGLSGFKFMKKSYLAMLINLND